MVFAPVCFSSDDPISRIHSALHLIKKEAQLAIGQKLGQHPLLLCNELGKLIFAFLNAKVFQSV